MEWLAIFSDPHRRVKGRNFEEIIICWWSNLQRCVFCWVFFCVWIHCYRDFLTTLQWRWGSLRKRTEVKIPGMDWASIPWLWEPSWLWLVAGRTKNMAPPHLLRSAKHLQLLGVDSCPKICDFFLEKFEVKHTPTFFFWGGIVKVSCWDFFVNPWVLRNGLGTNVYDHFTLKTNSVW